MTNEISGVLRSHISLDVANVPTSIEFYRALFGTDPVKVKHDYAKFELEQPALNFSINERQVTKGGSLNHLGFQVGSTEDVLKAKERLESSGLVSFDEMDVTCCYAKQDKIWVHDPDGNAWEFFVVTEADVDIRDERPDSTSTVNCCVPTARVNMPEVNDLVRANEELELAKVVCC